MNERHDEKEATAAVAQAEKEAIAMLAVWEKAKAETPHARQQLTLAWNETVLAFDRVRKLRAAEKAK